MRNTTAIDNNNNLMISLTRSNDDKIAIFLGPCMLSVLDWCFRRILMSVTNRRSKTPHYIFFIALSTKIIIFFYYFLDELMMIIYSVFILFEQCKIDLGWTKNRQVDCVKYEWYYDMGIDWYHFNWRQNAHSSKNVDQ